MSSLLCTRACLARKRQRQQLGLAVECLLQLPCQTFKQHFYSHFENIEWELKEKRIPHGFSNHCVEKHERLINEGEQRPYIPTMSGFSSSVSSFLFLSLFFFFLLQRKQHVARFNAVLLYWVSCLSPRNEIFSLMSNTTTHRCKYNNIYNTCNGCCNWYI